MHVSELNKQLMLLMYRLQAITINLMIMESLENTPAKPAVLPMTRMLFYASWMQ